MWDAPGPGALTDIMIADLTGDGVMDIAVGANDALRIFTGRGTVEGDWAPSLPEGASKYRPDPLMQL